MYFRFHKAFHKILRLENTTLRVQLIACMTFSNNWGEPEQAPHYREFQLDLPYLVIRAFNGITDIGHPCIFPYRLYVRSLCFRAAV